MSFLAGALQFFSTVLTLLFLRNQKSLPFFLSQLIATSQTLVSLCIRFGAEVHPGFVMNSITMLSVHPLLVHLFGKPQIVG